MKTALVFPGQGSQAVGMGKALADEFRVAREIFNRVDGALDPFRYGIRGLEPT